jgi:glycine cleavage system H protein
LLYHLCDHDYDCDHCPLHHALSPGTKRPAASNGTWPLGRGYTRNHLWVERLSDERVRVGITAFGAQVLNPVIEWQMANRGAQLKSSTPVATAVTTAGPLQLMLPFDATIVDTNPRVKIDPLWPIADPWESGYLAVLKPDDPARMKAACRDLDLASHDYVQHKRHVAELLRKAGEMGRPETMAADGGLPINGLAQALGLRQYRALLKLVFAA